MEIKFGWVCPICKEIYDTLEEAEICLENHVEYSLEPSYAISNPWPINVRVWKVVAGQLTAWKDYETTGELHEVKQ